jgi:hypothetical protein
LRSFTAWGIIGSPCYFCIVWWLPIQPAVLVLAEGPCLLTFLLSAVESLCRGLVPRMWKTSLLLSPCGLRVEWGMQDGQANHGRGNVLQGFSVILSPCF